VLDDDTELPFDLFLGVPKHRAPDVVSDYHAVGVDAEAVLGDQSAVELAKDRRVDAQHPSPRGELLRSERIRLGRVLEQDWRIRTSRRIT